MDTPHETPAKTVKKKSPELLKILSVAAIIIVACGISFFAGAAYQKSKQPAALQTAMGGFSDGRDFSTGRGGSMRQNGIIGNVTAVSVTSISVNNQRTGTSSTKTINDSTAITNNGTKATADSIKVGDSVLIQTSTTDPTIATSIDVNPSLPMGRPQSSTNTTDGAQLNTQTN